MDVRPGGALGDWNESLPCAGRPDFCDLTLVPALRIGPVWMRGEVPR